METADSSPELRRSRHHYDNCRCLPQSLRHIPIMSNWLCHMMSPGSESLESRMRSSENIQCAHAKFGNCCYKRMLIWKEVLHMEMNIFRNHVFTSVPNRTAFALLSLWNAASLKVLRFSSIQMPLRLCSQEPQDKRFSAAITEAPDGNSRDK